MKLSIKKPNEDSRAHPDHGHRVVIKHHVTPGHPVATPDLTPGKSKTPWLLIHLGLMLVIGGTAIGFFVHTRTVAGQTQRREALMQKEAFASAAGSIERVRRSCKHVTDFAAVVAQCCAEGSNLVRSVIADSPVLKEEHDPAPAAASLPAPAAAPGEKAPSPPAVPPAADSAPPVPADNDDDAARPYGMPSKSQMEALRRADSQAPAAAAADAPSEPLPARTAARSRQRQAQAQAFTPIETAMQALKQHAVEMSALSEQAGATLMEAENLKASMAEKTRSSEMAECATGLAALATQAEGAREGVAHHRKGAEERLAEIRVQKLQIENDRKEAQRKAEEERLERERQAAIARELTACEQAHAATTNFVRHHEYAQAFSNLTVALAELRTAPARGIMQRHVDRFRRMQELKEFLMARIRKEPFGWGWGTGTTARDVIGADESGIQLRGARAEWSEVDPSQMLKFMRFYLVQKKLGDKDLYAKMCLAAAVYFSEAGEAHNSARYMKDAVAADEQLAQEAARLIEPPSP